MEKGRKKENKKTCADIKLDSSNIQQSNSTGMFAVFIPWKNGKRV